VKDFTQIASFHLDPKAGGMDVKETERWIAPTFFRQESQLPAGKIAAYSDGRTGWISTPQGYGPLVGAQLKQVQGDLFRLYFRLLLSDRIEGRTVNAVDDNTLEITDKDGQMARVSFDEKTGLPAHVQYEAVHVTGPPETVQDNFSDYRDVGGLKIPFHVVITRGGQNFADVVVSEAKVNSGLKLDELGKR